MADNIILSVIIAVSAVLYAASASKMMNIYQLSGYKTKGVLNWFKSSKCDYLIRYFSLAFLSTISMAVFYSCFQGYSLYAYIGYVFNIVFATIFCVITTREKKKTPTRYTPRMLRFIIMTVILFGLLSFGLGLLVKRTPVPYYIFGAVFLFVPLIVQLAHWILSPIERLNNYSYKVKAGKKLAAHTNLIKIGITGSFGKTTAKIILAQMLSKKYSVCFSQQSYNTPMGLCKVINYDLNDTHQVFIAEMGARNKGDIKELAQLIKPNYGFITAIGKQHLESFGSINDIKNTKFELIENLSVGGVSIFNGDSEGARELYDRCTTPKFVTGGSESGGYISYDNVKFSAKGTSFDVLFPDGEKAEFTTVLLGRHIPSLIVMCLVIAFNLGISKTDLAEAVRELKPVEHRLELIDKGNVIVLDDAYNSNCEGALNAILVMREFSGKKIIVTPGLVEMGVMEKEANFELGQNIGKYCDYAFLVGSRAKDIEEGARAAGMDQDRIVCVNSLEEASERLKQIEGIRVVLFENDLPDNMQ